MSTPNRGEVVLRAVLIALGGAVVLSLFMLSEHLAPRQLPADTLPIVAGPTTPIPEEANVFAIGAGVLALPASGARSRDAHPRTLASVRSARAFPGAPPRIPHGFTEDEFRTGACATCHARGGYALRFGAYVPVTPHPEQRACLQCHVGDDAVIGVVLPGSDPGSRCRQCHLPTGGLTADIRTNWRPLAWPTLSRSAASGPPVIPHDLASRSNCLACHAGPSAVAEIRTTHPERVNCRQCHLTASAAEPSYRRGGRTAGGPE